MPYAPGGATDIVGRILADQLGKSLGQQFYVENKPGAFGMLAIEDMVHSPADGYTLMIGNVSTNAITPIIYAQKLTFDYVKDVVPITNTVDVPAFMVATKKNFDVKTVPALIDFAKKNPGQVRYGTVGNGSYPHYDMAYFAKRAGDLDMVAIPNKAGASGVINDMLTGSTQVVFPQRGEHRAAGEGGKLAAARRRQSCAARRLSRSADHAGGRLSRRRHHRLAGPVRAGRHAERRVADDLQCHGRGDEDAGSRRRRSTSRPSISFPMPRSPTPRPGSAQQMDTWRKITSEVKIETE